MKNIIFIFLFLLSLQSWTKADEISDFEINEKVILTLFDGSENPKVEKVFPRAADSMVIASKSRVTFSDGSIIISDFCNNPSDAWPIIVDNEICINALPGGDFTLWCSNDKYHSDLDVAVYSENPLRAAMICFLKMNEVKS